MIPSCEFRRYPFLRDHRPCGAPGMWSVTSSRLMNPVISCGRHLSLTVTQIIGATVRDVAVSRIGEPVIQEEHGKYGVTS